MGFNEYFSEDENKYTFIKYCLYSFSYLKIKKASVIFIYQR